MRQLTAWVPRGEGRRALEWIRELGGVNLARLDASGPERDWDLLVIHVQNHLIEAVVDRLQSIEEARITLNPRGVIPLYPPSDAAPDQVADVSPRSPLEIFFGGIQSIGSWKGFLGYAAVAGVVVWVGLYTDTVFLLTAAMLIAPFAGPAMNLALGTARGDATLIGRSVLRYFASLALSIAVAAALTWLWGLRSTTALILANSMVPATAVLLPLAAGAAGALNLCQSERNSLVTAAGTGVLVAASLAPPAGVVGIAVVLQEWGMVGSAGFLLLLQLVGINLSGALVFALFGIRPQGVRYARGHSWLRWVTLAFTGAGLAGLLTLQWVGGPALKRSSRAQELEARVEKRVRDSDLVHPVEVNANFTRAPIAGQETLLIEVYAQRSAGVERSLQEIEEQLRREIQQDVRSADPQVAPLVDLTVLDPG